jgi:DNA-binding IclR family transcriptional regulator
VGDGVSVARGDGEATAAFGVGVIGATGDWAAAVSVAGPDDGVDGGPVVQATTSVNATASRPIGVSERRFICESSRAVVYREN